LRARKPREGALIKPAALPLRASRNGRYPPSKQVVGQFMTDLSETATPFSAL